LVLVQLVLVHQVQEVVIQLLATLLHLVVEAAGLALLRFLD
jgi:hypothetical protein